MLYIFEDNEVVIQKIIKGRSPTMRHVSKTHRLALDWLFIASIWTPRSKSNTLTPRTNSQTYWQREISHVMSGTIFCVWSTLAISAPSTASKLCRTEHKKMQVKKESQQNQKPMTNLVSRCRVRDPNVLTSTASEKPEKTKSESQEVPLSSWNEQQPRTGRPVMGASSSNSSEWNNDDKWSSQVRKSGEMSGTSTGRPVSNRLVIDIDMDSDTPFIPEQNEWPIAKDAEAFSRRFNARHWQTFYDLVNVYVFDSGSICIHGKELLRKFAFHQKYSGKSHFKEDVRDIWTVDIGTIGWDFWSVSNQLESSPWKQLSLVNDEDVISLSHAKVYVLSDSVLCLGNMNQNPTSNTVWERQLGWFKDSSQYRTLDTIDGDPMEFEWNIFPGFTTLQLVDKVQKFMNKMSDPDQFQGRIIFMSMFNDIIWGINDNELECIANAQLVSLLARRFLAGRWSFLGPGSETKWYSTNKERPGGKWDRVAELMMIKFGESGHPVFRATSPFSRGMLKRKGGGKLSIHLCRWWNDWNCFSHNHFCQSAKYLRSSLRFVWRLLWLSNKNTETCGRAIWSTFRASRLTDNDTTPSIEILAQENRLQKHKE